MKKYKIHRKTMVTVQDKYWGIWTVKKFLYKRLLVGNLVAYFEGVNLQQPMDHQNKFNSDV